MSEDHTLESACRDLEEQLLRSAKLLDDPSPAGKERARALGAAGGGVGLWLFFKYGLPRWTYALATWKSALVVGTTLATAMVGYVEWRHETKARAVDSQVNATQVSARAPAMPEPVAPPVAPERVADPGPAPAPLAPVVTMQTDSPKGSTASKPTENLGSQIALLDRARSLSQAGQAAQALRVLDEYEQRFPKGALAQEATVARVEALFQSGRSEAAIALANRFLDGHPSSSHAARLRKLVDAHRAPSPAR
jgi:hypothetical protein